MRGARLVVGLLLATLAVPIVLASTPVSAGGPDTWGFYYRSPRSGPPGSQIFAALSSQADWNEPWDPSLGLAMDHLPRIMACSNDVSDNLTTWLIDPDGRLVVRGERIFPITGSPALLTVPEGTAPGTYSVREACFVDGELHAACIDIEVTAAGSALAYEDPLERGVPLWSDACPRAPWIVAGDAARRVGVRLAGLRRFLDAFRGVVIPGPPVTVTTVVPQATNPPVIPPNNPGPAPDTQGPSVSGISGIRSGNNCVVSATITDNVSVSTSASFTYSGGLNGGGTLSGPGGAGGTYSGSFFAPNGGPFSISIQVVDSAGNPGSGQGTAECKP